MGKKRVAPLLLGTEMPSGSPIGTQPTRKTALTLGRFFTEILQSIDPEMRKGRIVLSENKQLFLGF